MEGLAEVGSGAHTLFAGFRLESGLSYLSNFWYNSDGTFLVNLLNTSFGLVIRATLCRRFVFPVV